MLIQSEIIGFRKDRYIADTVGIDVVSDHFVIAIKRRNFIVVFAWSLLEIFKMQSRKRCLLLRSIRLVLPFDQIPVKFNKFFSFFLRPLGCD